MTAATKYATADEAEAAGLAVTRHELIPAADADEADRRATCATDGHPASCFNPWFDATFCRCGARRIPGDHCSLPPAPPVCDDYVPCLLDPFCRNCFHDRGEHAGQPADPAVDALPADGGLFPMPVVETPQRQPAGAPVPPRQAPRQQRRSSRLKTLTTTGDVL